MRYLVTGVAGFIGSAIARKLLDLGKEVVGVDSLTDYYDPRMKQRNLERLAARGLDYEVADLNQVDLAKLLESIDIILHQAGQPGVRSSWGNEFTVYTQDNINATQRLLEAAVEARSVRRVVYASSSSVYGDAETFPSQESHLPRPTSPYGVSKLAAEHLCGLYASNFGIHTVSLRYFTVYGPGQRPDMAFTRFLRAAINGDAVQVYGSGQQIRDFTFVEDVVEANLRAASGDCSPGSVLNVAGGTSISINDTLTLIAEISGTRLKVVHLGAVRGDVLRTGGSTETIRSTLGWEPRTSIEDGLRSQLQWVVETYRDSEAKRN